MTNTPQITEAAANGVADAVAAIKRGWLAEHGPEGVRLQRTDVWEIAFRLVKAGVQPTVEHIRNVNEGGSPNVIHPAVREFFATQLHRRWMEPKPLEGVPEPVMKLWAQLLDSASHIARADLADERSRLDAAHEALAATIRSLEQREHEFEGRRTELERLVRTVQSEIVEARQAKDAAAGERDRAYSDRDLAVEASNRERDVARDAMDAAMTQLAEANEARTGLEALVTDLRSTAMTTEQALTNERNAHTATADQLAAATKKLSDAEAALDSALKRHVSELEAANVLLESAENRRAEIVASNAAHQREAEARLSTTNAALATAKGELAGVAQARDALQEALDSVKATVTDLRAIRSTTEAENQVLRADLAAALAQIRALEAEQANRERPTPG